MRIKIAKMVSGVGLGVLLVGCVPDVGPPVQESLSLVEYAGEASKYLIPKYQGLKAEQYVEVFEPLAFELCRVRDESPDISVEDVAFVSFLAQEVNGQQVLDPTKLQDFISFTWEAFCQ